MKISVKGCEFMKSNNNEKIFQSNNTKDKRKTSCGAVNLNNNPSDDFTNTNHSKKYNFTDIDHMIHSGKSTVTLDGNVVLEEAETEEYLEGIGIDVNDFTLNGNGFSIDAKGMTQIFKITGENVKITNVTLKNGFTEKYGGSINNNGELTLVNVLLQKNNAELNGGSIYNQKKISIDHCKFMENSASISGALHNEHKAEMNVTDSVFEKNTAESGGALGNTGILTVKDSILNNNSGKVGGSISNNCSITLENCHLSSNNAKDIGGSVYNMSGGIVKVRDSVLENNSAKNGGAIYSEDSTIDVKKCSFKDNFSQENGAAIDNLVTDNCMPKKSDNILSNTCVDCDIVNNHSNKYGAIYTNDNINFIGCNFKDNIADEEGNIIYFEPPMDIPLTIEDSFIDNSSAENSDIYIKNPSLLNIKDTDIRNVSDNYVIDNQNGTVNISNISFENDKQSIFNNGTIWLDDEVTANHVKSTQNAIIRNKSESSNPENGFRHMEDLINGDSEIVTLDCDIHMHESERFQYPEGIELHGNNLVIDGQNHIIDANKLSRIFKIDGTNITLKNIQFKNGCYFKSKVNETTEGGGVIYTLPTASVTINDCIFIENDSNNLAGCINNKGVMNVHNSIFKNNYAQRICGSIFNSNILDLKDCIFENNFAQYDSSSRDYYLKSRGNIVNKSKIRINRCEFKNTKYFFIEFLRIGISKSLKILMIPFAFSIFGFSIGFPILLLLSLVFPSQIINGYSTELLKIVIIVFVFAMAVSLILAIIGRFTNKYMENHGFENRYMDMFD